MQENKEVVLGLCDAVLEDLRRRISCYYNTQDNDILPPFVMCNIYDEVDKMRQTLNPQVFEPSYPLQLFEKWRESDLFITLIELADKYRQLVQQPPPENLRSLLNILRKRPGIYLGRKSLISLNNFIDGYQTALQLHSIKEEYFFDSSHFSKWLVLEHKFDMSCVVGGWAKYLSTLVPNEDEVFKWFFQLYDEYLKLEPKVCMLMENVDISQCASERLKTNPYRNNRTLPNSIEVVRLYPKRWCFLKYNFPCEFSIGYELYRNHENAIKAVESEFGVSSENWLKLRRPYVLSISGGPTGKFVKDGKER